MEGYQVATINQVVAEIDISVTTTGNFKTITLEPMNKMKNNAIVGNISHFDNEIEMVELEGSPEFKVDIVQIQVDRVVFPDGHSIITLHLDACANDTVVYEGEPTSGTSMMSRGTTSSFAMMPLSTACSEVIGRQSVGPYPQSVMWL